MQQNLDKNIPTAKVAENLVPNRILASLDAARREMLETGKRNRLINTPRKKGKSKSLEIIDELSDEVFNLLVRQRKSMNFVPGLKSRGDNLETNEESLVYIPPVNDEVDQNGRAGRHLDVNLQTSITPESLQTKLLSIYRDSRTIEEEQGVNVLYLALGFVKWFESESSQVENWAPLILVPVELDRKSVRGRFQLTFRDEDMSANLSFQEMLRSEHKIKFPDLPDNEEWTPSDYFKKVKECISDKKRWEVDYDAITLGFFSFSKFLMFKDLELASWPEGTFESHPFISALLGEGFPADTALYTDDTQLDEVLDPSELIHILDADSSQTQVIESVKRGKSLVVQGPPGTGKSQTIANIIGAAVHSGKTVLFVAEKMAALEVVHRRLAKLGLADICLELHSRKANKLVIIEDLRKTLNSLPAKAPSDNLVKRLRQTRDELNRADKLLHTPIPTSGLTPYWALGELVSLHQAGVLPPDIQLVEAAKWTNEQAEILQRALARLIQAMETAGPKDSHPWRGVQATLTPTDIKRLKPLLESFQEVMKECIGLVKAINHTLQISHDWKVNETEILQKVLVALSQRPTMPLEIFNLLTQADTKQVNSLIESVNKFNSIKDTVNQVFIDAAWSSDVSIIRRDIAAYGASIMRLFNKDFRQASAQLRGLLRNPKLPVVAEQITLLDKLIEAQKLRKVLDSQQALGEATFGSYWQAEKSDVALLDRSLKWVTEVVELALPDSISVQAILSLPFDTGQLRTWAASILEKIANLDSSLGQINQLTNLDFKQITGNLNHKEASLSKIQICSDAWVTEYLRLDEWSQLCLSDKILRECSGEFVANLLADGSLSPEQAKDFVRYIRAEALWKAAIEQAPELATIDGVERSRLVNEFKDLDLKRQQMAVQEIAVKHSLDIPRGSAGDMGVIRGEIAKKRGLKSVRKLVSEAGRAIQKIKPVFMMSPLSVAQFLPRSNLSFDLLLIDEASQVKPADAFGAVLRANQIVVVGDSKQLPPTSFFDSVTVEDSNGTDEDEDIVPITKTSDVESILKLCESKQLPFKDLRWHYRSKHPSLIQVSNQQFYQSRLLLPPSPYADSNSLGMTAVRVNGVYDRGNTRTNTIEGNAVVQAVIEHFRNNPDKTLGVAALSSQQRDEINRLLDYERAKYPDLEQYFLGTGHEPFFVKNLENVQGDERDVILISIGYGPTIAGGRLDHMTFGPVSQDGGERRLNVLFSRARERCVVFSSFSSAEIDTARTTKGGPAVLKQFLRYAESGILDVPTLTGDDFDSPFEESVARAIQALGYEVDAQVGSAGFKIDLAVKDPDCPGHYMLAVECDGAAYHSSLWARDRDRLRQAVLESQGWRFYRIWSTDWFRQPERALQALVHHLEEARKIQDIRAATPSYISSTPLFNISLPTSIEREEATEESSNDVIPYIEAKFSVPSHLEPHKVDITKMADMVVKTVEIEGPIHEDEVARRITRLFGLQRSGARINECVLTGLKKAQKDGRLQHEKHFWSSSNAPVSVVRDRTDVTSLELWKPEMLPPAEIKSGILAMVDLHFGISEDKLCVEIARLFGFKKTSSQLKDVFVSHIKKMTKENHIRDVEGKLYLP